MLHQLLLSQSLSKFLTGRILKHFVAARRSSRLPTQSDLKDELCMLSPYVTYQHTHNQFGLRLEIQTPRPMSGSVFLPLQLYPDLASRVLCP